ncbi:general secretion pathway protein GspK [Prosthecobacter sp.]|uniref:general secretion pathway protein GspK n=1 Tax=Prosthecobacter sp. TaxID=1965333 RepID=UPI003784BCB2
MQRGSALIVVFWMIAVLGMVVFAGAKALQADSQYTRMMRGRIFAKRYAEMGIEVARHPVMREDDPLLHFNANDGGGYNVKLVAEEARLNANHLIQTGDKVLLRRLFTSWGFKEQFVSALCDALKDWVDADGNVSLNGAEKRDYVNIERPDWREWFTVFGDGRVDVNDARPELIALLADLPLERVQPLLKLRAGRDGALHTQDDVRLSSVPQVAQLLGVYQPQILAQLTQWIQFAGPIRRIESVGSLGPLQRKLILITQDGKAVWRGEIPAHGKNT